MSPAGPWTKAQLRPRRLPPGLRRRRLFQGAAIARLLLLFRVLWAVFSATCIVCFYFSALCFRQGNGILSLIGVFCVSPGAVRSIRHPDGFLLGVGVLAGCVQGALPASVSPFFLLFIPVFSSTTNAKFHSGYEVRVVSLYRQLR